MRNKLWFFLVLISVIAFLTLNVSAQDARIPTVGGDDGTWGTVLNEFLNVSLNDTGHLRANNLTLGQRITFALGEIIDNLVDGWVRVTGGLNVTGNAIVDGNFTVNNSDLFVNTNLGRVGIGTSSPSAALDVNGNASLNNTLYVTESGNVGIGTNTPQQKLDVVGGHINVTGTSSNSSFSGDVRILGKLYGGSPVKIAGGLNVTGDAHTEGNKNITGNLTVDGGALYVEENTGRIGIGTINPQNKLHVAGGSVKHVLNNNSFTVVGTYSSGITDLAAIDVHGDYVYIVDDFSSDLLRVIDVSDPANPVQTDTASIGPSSGDGAYANGYAYVVDSSVDNDRLEIYDVSNPDDIFRVTTHGVDPSPVKVEVFGNYAYVTDSESDDLVIVDVSDPSNPVTTADIPYTLAITIDTYYHNGHLYMVNNNEIEVINVTDPYNPVITDKLNIGTDMRGVAAEGDYLYVTDEDTDHVRVIDISNPASLSEVSNVSIGGNARDIDVAGGYAYVVDTASESIIVVDVTNPNAPVLVAESGSLGTNLNSEIHVQGRYAYVIDNGPDDLLIVELPVFDTFSLLARSAEVGDLYVTQDANIEGVINVKGGISAEKASFFRDGVRISQTSNLAKTSSALEVTGNTTVEGDLNVTGFYYGNGSGLTGLTESQISDLGNYITWVNAVNGTLALNSSLADYARWSEVVNSTLNNTINAIVNNGTFMKTDGDTATGNYTFDTSTLFVDSTRNRIGIGTANPSQKLTVAGNMQSFAESGSISHYFGTFNGTSGSGAGLTYDFDTGFLLKAINVGTSFKNITFEGADIFFRTGLGTLDDSVVITDEGRVGIGNLTPSVPLHVIENKTDAGVARFDNKNNSGFSGIYFDRDSTVQGWVGHVGNESGFGGPGNMQLAAGRGNLTFSVDALESGFYNERMRITTDGNVGINTTTPVTTLDVNGNVGISENNVTTPLHVTLDEGSQLWTPINTIATFEDDALGFIDIVADNVAGIKFSDNEEHAVGGVHYDHAENLLSLIAGSGEKVYINTNGRVGIGTANPQQILNVVGATNITGDLDVDANTLFVHSGNNYVGINTNAPSQRLSVGGSNPFINFLSSSTNERFVGGYHDDGAVTSSTLNGLQAGTFLLDTAGDLHFSSRGNSSSNIVFYTHNGTSVDERMRVASSGRLGVGTNSPDALLELSNRTENASLLRFETDRSWQFASRFNGAATQLQLFSEVDAKWFRISADDKTTHTASFFTSSLTPGNQRVNLVPDGGRVGIGTSSPETPLHIEGNNSALQTLRNTASGQGSFTQWYDHDDTIRLIVGTDGSFFSGTDNQASIATWTNHPIAFFTNQQQRMILDTSGNLGIGTATPSAKLHIDTGDNSTVPFRINGTNETGGSVTHFYVDNASGSVGIGTNSPSGDLTVYDAEDGTNVRIDTGSATNDAAITFLQQGSTFGRVGYDHSNSAVKLVYGAFSNNGIAIDSSNNVGIGTTDPGTALHVHDTGDVNVLRLEDDDGTCNQNPEAGSITTSCSSDEELKENIHEAESVLDDFEKIEIKDYTIRESGDETTGVIAQEIQETNPELVEEIDGELFVEQPNPWKLLKAIQELEEQIDELQKQIDEIDGQPGNTNIQNNSASESTEEIQNQSENNSVQINIPQVPEEIIEEDSILHKSNETSNATDENETLEITGVNESVDKNNVSEETVVNETENPEEKINETQNQSGKSPVTGAVIGTSDSDGVLTKLIGFVRNLF